MHYPLYRVDLTGRRPRGLALSVSSLSLDWKSLSAALDHPAAGWAVTLVNLLLVALLASSLAHLTWRVLPAPPPRPAPPLDARPAASAGHAAARGQAVQRIATLHLFGDATAVAQVTAPPAVMPETKLDLVLRGVLAVKDKVRAQAIIAQPNGQEQSYGIGSPLPGGAVLKDITPTSVILLRNNQYETLSLPREEVAQGLGGQPPLPNGTVQGQSTFPDMSLRQVRDTLLSNPQKLAGLIDAQPYTGDNGQMMGYRVAPGGNSQMFERYGLRPGDIVTSIDGIALTSPSSAFAVLRGLPSRHQVQVQLLRNGVPQTLTLQIQ